MITTNDIDTVDKIAQKNPAKLTFPLWHSMVGFNRLPGALLFLSVELSIRLALTVNFIDRQYE